MDEKEIEEIGSAICLAITLLSAIGCLLIQIAMVEGINSKLGPDARLSWLSRDQARIFKEHRRHFPESRLPTVFIFLLLATMLCGVGFAMFLA